MSPIKASMSLLFFLLISLTLSSSFSSAVEYDSVYDLLKAYGLPKGIIPEGVANNDFTFDPSSGKLEIKFPFLEGNGICKVTRTVDIDVLHMPIPIYNRVDLQATISATLQYQHLVDIEGITATVKLGEVTLVSDVKIVTLEVSEDGKTLRFVSSIPFVESPEFPITDDFDIPQKCDADLTVSPMNMIPLFDKYPFFFYKRAFGRRA